MFSRRAASEFPNDNPELHDGLVWACPRPLARALPTLRLRAPAGPLPRVLGPDWDEFASGDPAQPSEGAPREAEEALAVSEPSEAVSEPSEAVSEPSEAEPNEEPAPCVPSTPSGVFVATLARVALARGATRAAAALTALFEHGRLSPGALDEATVKGLVARRILTATGTQLTPELRAARDAWRGVLDGITGDLSGCGAATLDAWAAELLAAVMNLPSAEAATLRRELRRAGVAAFGLLAVA